MKEGDATGDVAMPLLADTDMKHHGEAAIDIVPEALKQELQQAPPKMFKLKHENGKYVHPCGGSAYPSNNTRLVFWEGARSDVGGEDALTFEKVELGGGRFKLKHRSGKYVHPHFGNAYPDNGTRLVLYEGARSDVGGEDALTFVIGYRFRWLGIACIGDLTAHLHGVL